MACLSGPLFGKPEKKLLLGSDLRIPRCLSNTFSKMNKLLPKASADLAINGPKSTSRGEVRCLLQPGSATFLA